MESSQPMKVESASASPVGTSDASTGSGLVAVMENDASTNSSDATTATTPLVSRKTWTSVELEELQLKAGLVAGALADFQSAGGLVVVKNIEYEPGCFAVKVYLVAEGINLRTQKTTDGLDFEVLPRPGGSPEAE